MDNENPNRRGKSFIILGLVSIAILFLIYGRYQDPELVTPDAIDSYLRLANGFYVVLLLSFGAIAFGLYRFHKQKAESNAKGLLYIIALVTWNSKSRKIFVATFVMYGIFFSLTSGTLVYQPEVIFSYHYGVGTATYLLRMFAQAFFGEPVQRWNFVGEMTWPERAAATVLAVSIMFMGLWPAPFIDRISQTVINIPGVTL